MAELKCPICRAPAVARIEVDSGRPDPVFPFCSPRCQLVDLGRWLDGDYCIADDPAEGYGEGPSSSSDGEG